jgi:hypothetical protein
MVRRFHQKGTRIYSDRVMYVSIVLICQDNGRGMPHDDIPNMLGRGMSPNQAYRMNYTNPLFLTVLTLYR